MTTEIEKKKETKVARPLSVIAGEIKKEREAAKADSKGHWITIAVLLVEAFTHFSGNWDDFKSWFQGQEFDFQFDSAKERMLGLSNIEKNAAAFSPRPSLRSARAPGYRMPDEKLREAVKASIEASRRIMAAAATKKKEDELVRKLALQIVDIGFKTLSIKLHPDKGGSPDAMRRLNAARALLKRFL